MIIYARSRSRRLDEPCPLCGAGAGMHCLDLRVLGEVAYKKTFHRVPAGYFPPRTDPPVSRESK